IAFPRLNAFSYWIYLFGGLFLWTSFALDIGPDIGWFGYVPLSGPQFAPGKRADTWAQMITFTEVAALAVAAEIITTVFKQRAPGMALDRIPIFVWSMLVTSFLVLFAMPAVMFASSVLIMDRLIGTHFFNPAEGGDVLLWASRKELPIVAGLSARRRELLVTAIAQAQPQVPGSFARSFNLAARERHCGGHPVHLVHLHALGRGLGCASRCHCSDRLVL